MGKAAQWLFCCGVLFVKSGQAKFLLALPVKKVWKTGRAKALFFSFYRQKILLRI